MSGYISVCKGKQKNNTIPRFIVENLFPNLSCFGVGGSGLKVAQLLWLEAEHRKAQPVGRFVQREPGGAERMPRIPQQMDAACRSVAFPPKQINAYPKAANSNSGSRILKNSFLNMGGEFKIHKKKEDSYPPFFWFVRSG